MATRIGIIGGTGREGRGLALRWAKAGHAVKVGSRDEAKAKAKAEELRGEGGAGIEGGSNEWAAREADVVILSVPYGVHAETLRPLKEALAGKVLVDISVPLKPPKVGEVHLPEGQAAALEAQAILGVGTKVVAALHHVSSAHLGEGEGDIDSDVLACSDDAAALALVIDLIKDLGMRGLDAGPLRNAIALESLTPVLLHMGKRYKSPGLGVRITGIR